MHWLPAILVLPYVFLLLTIYRSLLRIKSFKVSAEPVTFVSLVVACHNESKNLPVLLNCIALQNYPESLFEVILVDDNSTDKTLEIADGFTGLSNIHTINNQGSGKKQALRTGILISKGNLIMTTDADCRMGKNWIRTIASFYDTNRPDMMICPVTIESVRGIFGRFQELEFLSLQGVTAGSAWSGKATMCNGANLAFNREAYLNHIDNLHDEINSGDDVFLLHSMKKETRSKIFWLESPDVLVTAQSSPTLGSFLKQRSRWISKGKAYQDLHTITLGIITFFTIVLQVYCFIALFINPAFIKVFLTIFILKSFPDLLILLNTSARYKKRYLMKWFIPAQAIYPFYVLSVVFYSLISREK